MKIKLLGIFSVIFTSCVLSGCGSSEGESGSVTAIQTDSDSSLGGEATYQRYVIQNHVPLISLTDENTVDDLHTLAASIGERRIVQLGESTHGSRQMSQIKTRIIKYLHKNHDFNVIAFESSAFACNQEVNQGRKLASKDLLQGCLFGIWHSHEVLDLFEYIVNTQSTDRPLKVVGFDVQLSGLLDTPNYMTEYFESAIDAEGVSTTLDIESLFLDIAQISRLSYSCEIQDNSQSCDTISSTLPDAQAALDRLQALFIHSTMTSKTARFLATSFSRMLRLEEVRVGGSIAEGMASRDQSMADNVIELATELYPNEKMAIWAHNSHIAEYYSDHRTQYPLMGMHLNEYFGDDLFSIGLYMNQGASAGNRGESLSVRPHNVNSLESLTAIANQDVLYLPFSKVNQPGLEDDWLHRPYETKFWGTTNVQVELAKVYDGIIMVDRSTLPDYL
ncbi:hypothetical protein PCIT_a0960 [Pseudoalteromonas citrea]|uniref:Erythromycin esterase n=2 Tax=Pseudoalteromonas citrea TaxID=43655 RepID=A0AAD4FTI8_9GAMM|nr:erythromycin esterase family protein [Pseudoalteromonas citrea]KAF7774502.1 hypothetical protein PCIT_a0960 [Pseudoalteromonas citrea]